MYVVDANVLLYAINTDSAHHARARTWLDGSLAGTESVGFAWAVLLAFLRLSTSRAIFERPLTADEAISVVRIWLASSAAVIVEPGPRHLGSMASMLVEAGTAGNLVGDAHLAALAIEEDATLVSFDTDFARFAGLRWEQPPA
jgi:toxin-antitoxin system PIN domain toxin